MGKPYSLDLRERICAYISAGNSRRSAAEVFGVSIATAIRYNQQQRKDGFIAVKPQGRPPGKTGKLAPYKEFLTDIVTAEPDITLQELANALEETYDVHVGLPAIHKALDRYGFSYKKRADSHRTRA